MSISKRSSGGKLLNGSIVAFLSETELEMGEMLGECQV